MDKKRLTIILSIVAGVLVLTLVIALIVRGCSNKEVLVPTDTTATTTTTAASGVQTATVSTTTANGTPKTTSAATLPTADAEKNRFELPAIPLR